MKVYVYKDDWYCCGIDKNRDGVDVPDELVERYDKAVEEFGDVVSELEQYLCE